MNNRSLVHEIITLNVTHRYRVGKAASSLGLYFGQPAIIEYVSANNGCTQKELAEHLHISPPSVATTLKRMEKSGFIKRIEDKNDSRKKSLTVTEKGSSALKDFRKLCEETDSQLFVGFSEEEKEQLMSYLKRLNENIADSELSCEDYKKILKGSEK
ncbi:MAG: MarR family transcriptional regulator [Clostridia bacterium]|nr:MarR family transcriptional regulator [Clostridia bacterium]